MKKKSKDLSEFSFIKIAPGYLTKKKSRDWNLENQFKLLTKILLKLNNWRWPKNIIVPFNPQPSGIGISISSCKILYKINS